MSYEIRRPRSVAQSLLYEYPCHQVVVHPTKDLPKVICLPRGSRCMALYIALKANQTATRLQIRGPQAIIYRR